MLDFFLCHASKDKEKLVLPIADELALNGKVYYLDIIEIQGGVNIVDSIQVGMNESRMAIVFLTSNFINKSEDTWHSKELYSFISTQKYIIPIVYDAIPIKKIQEKYPLLASTYMINEVQDSQELTRRILRAYTFMLADKPMDRFLENCYGSIRYPIDGSLVNRSMVAKGDILSLPEYSWLWLVIEIGNLKFPKEPNIKVSGNRWEGVAFEGGTPPDNKFNLSLYVVGEEGNKQIKSWLEEGSRTGSYPGLTIMTLPRFDGHGKWLVQ